jgi:hypothetical protein
LNPTTRRSTPMATRRFRFRRRGKSSRRTKLGALEPFVVTGEFVVNARIVRTNG